MQLKHKWSQMIHNAALCFWWTWSSAGELSPTATLIFVVDFLNIFVSIGDQEATPHSWGVKHYDNSSETAGYLMMIEWDSGTLDILFFNSWCQEGISDVSCCSLRIDLASHEGFFFVFQKYMPRAAHSIMTSSFSCRAWRQDEPRGLPGSSCRQWLNPIKSKTVAWACET